MAGYRALVPEQPIEFTFEVGLQDGYEYRATAVRVTGDAAGTEPRRVVEDGPGYRSTLTVVMDDDAK
jgi:hypothetical protein